MQIKLADGAEIVAGKAIKDAEFKTVGEKQSRVASFALNVGKRKDTTTIFVNCKAWHGLAELAATIKKGDAVCVVGTVESREWNGKTYEDLTAEWLNVASKGNAPEHLPKAEGYQTPVSGADFAELSEDDGDLPF